MLSKEEKLRFLETLDKDKEFRYAIAGYLGLSEILKRLDSIESRIADLYEGQNRLWENAEKLWIEVRSLREGQDKLWMEVRDLREGQNKLWESVERLWLEVKSLREGQDRLWEEVKLSREEQVKLWEEVRDLRVEFEKMSREQRRLRSSFESFGRALGVTIEHYACAFVELMLEDMGYTGVSVNKGFVYYDGRIYEIDIFCEDPLVVGEATLCIRDKDEAESELKKLDVKVEAAEKSTGRKIILKVLTVANVSSDAMGYLKDECAKRGVRLVVGRELEVVA
jgi:hypothetical protein